MPRWSKHAVYSRSECLERLRAHRWGQLHATSPKNPVQAVGFQRFAKHVSNSFRTISLRSVAAAVVTSPLSSSSRRRRRRRVAAVVVASQPWLSRRRRRRRVTAVVASTTSGPETCLFLLMKLPGMSGRFRGSSWEGLENFIDTSVLSMEGKPIISPRPRFRPNHSIRLIA